MTGEEFAYMGSFIFQSLIGIGILVVLFTVFEVRKSVKYRKFLADMYVAAKIRFLAKEDKLDLVAESEDYKTWCKKERLAYRDYDLDNTIEEELKEKVSTPKLKE